MTEYRVEYSYLATGADGKTSRKKDVDFVITNSAQSAVDDVTRRYAGELADFRVEAVYREGQSRWNVVDVWT